VSKFTNIPPIPISEYDYVLPDERIAKYPLEQRDASKLLVYQQGNITEDIFRNAVNHLPDNSLLVYNNTRVIQARMVFRKPTGARIELFCLEPAEPSDYALSLGATGICSWYCMVGNLKKWKDESLTKAISIDEKTILIRATRINTTLPFQDLSPLSINKKKEATSKAILREKPEEQNELSSRNNTHLIRFEWDDPELCFADILDLCGELPIPPYLNRATEEQDHTSYQTVYSKIKGSVAAPTAGLHFTEAVLNDLTRKSIQTEELTLHVGAGTFQPVKTDDIADHQMHTEVISVRKSTLEKLLENEGNIIAVGTTSVRTLESLYYLGIKIIRHKQCAQQAESALPCTGSEGMNRTQVGSEGMNPAQEGSESGFHVLQVGQWDPYEMDISPQPSNSSPDNQHSFNTAAAGFSHINSQQEEISTREALVAIIGHLEENNLTSLQAQTQLMIRPGFRYRMIRGMFTNFHQPKSTLLVLVSAFAGHDWKNIYQYALKRDFRFLSYGDSSLLLR
jgi:S-adenosylmethionine:tRNA ribosyltransferase-isomerase